MSLFSDKLWYPLFYLTPWRINLAVFLFGEQCCLHLSLVNLDKQTLQTSHTFTLPHITGKAKRNRIKSKNPHIKTLILLSRIGLWKCWSLLKQMSTHSNPLSNPITFWLVKRWFFFLLCKMRGFILGCFPRILKGLDSLKSCREFAYVDVKASNKFKESHF